ncbi:MAG: hypothetical protein OH319_01870 [Candidatus Parvarchaeota archaeon]|nr:hypothetical protein [Candidatus Jingweiarchaeum tengchongense]MCW1298118.1 hypothetical protein [Candidatus Jingweiarchaeum tengchongense]MCW1299917.1 hypothetical protein [Candidatus Jingweiarchaeum tengchongense]MCW1305539.1 hypothetical protein [Candidatus Jingweiarchaeum tengchongense]MCW1309192.1 hypothetical protein [Candidatus Jingweiarchaeum tengchongense]
MTIIALGYIFSDYVVRLPIRHLHKNLRDEILLASIIVSPSIIFHEFAHKFVAVYFGGAANFHANFYGLLLGIAMKALGLPIIFIPAYVSVRGLYTTPIVFGLIAISGPLVNFAIFLILSLLLKFNKITGDMYFYALVIKEMNKLLFLFNMLPIPSTDGFNFYQALLNSI